MNDNPDTKVHSIRAYGNGCIGSLIHSTDIMISAMFTKDEKFGIYDFHLTNEQANVLIEEIRLMLDRNKRDGIPTEARKHYKRYEGEA